MRLIVWVHRRMRTCLTIGASLVCAVAGCSTGVRDDNLFASGSPAEHDGATGGNVTTSITAASTLEADGGSGSESSSDADSTAALDVADDGAEGGAESTTGGMSSDSGTDDDAEGSSTGDETGESTGAALMCPQEVMCSTAPGLGTVSGDESSPSLAYADDMPIWLKFEVSEDSSEILGAPMSFTATLTSPPCCDFDLYVYRGVEGGSTGCGGTLQSSISVGAIDTVSMDWGEDEIGLSDGEDNDAWVAVEIIPKNDECEAGADWSLTVQGHT